MDAVAAFLLILYPNSDSKLQFFCVILNHKLSSYVVNGWNSKHTYVDTYVDP